MAKLSKPDTYPKGEQCAFAGAGYQVMRNIAAAFQQAQKVDVDWRVIFAFPGDNATAEAISLIRQRLQDAHKRRVLILNYRELAVALARSKDLISMRLAEHMAVRLGIALPAAPSEQ
jgi:hypothetical protein